MRARGIVKAAEISGGRACVFLTHVDDVASFKPGDELYTRADVPELVALHVQSKCAAEQAHFHYEAGRKRGLLDAAEAPAGEWLTSDDSFAVSPDPDAPTTIAALPDYWDERRKRQGKPDLSRCAAELRVALASSGDVLVRDLDGMDHDTVDSALLSEPHTMEHVLASMLRRRFPKPVAERRTPDDLERIIRNKAHLGSDSPEFNEALSHLVTLAGLAAEKAGAR